ncbi:hypothetical protein VRK_01930 [Vibrio sp. MEBiC08052]|nr:hypothetical protein VRK_01930 [Vibrio sp. MEBiC08052]
MLLDSALVKPMTSVKKEVTGMRLFLVTTTNNYYHFHVKNQLIILSVDK